MLTVLSITVIGHRWLWHLFTKESQPSRPSLW